MSAMSLATRRQAETALRAVAEQMPDTPLHVTADRLARVGVDEPLRPYVTAAFLNALVQGCDLDAAAAAGAQAMIDGGHSFADGDET